jgi:hypothetical protein
LKLVLEGIFAFLEAMANFALYLDENTAQVAQVCGTDGASLSIAAKAIGTEACILATALFAIVEFFGCRNWHSIYATAAHNAVCYELNTGLAWCAATQIVIVVCSMIILTCRVAFKEVDDEDGLSTNELKLAEESTLPQVEQGGFPIAEPGELQSVQTGLENPQPGNDDSYPTPESATSPTVPSP